MAAPTSDKPALMEIEPPAPPPEDYTGIVVASGALALLLAVALVLGVRRSRWWGRYRTRRRIEGIARRLAENRIEPRAAAFSVASVLRRYYGLNRIGSGIPSPLSAKADDWAQFMNQLNRARYRWEAPQRDEVMGLCGQARLWCR